LAPVENEGRVFLRVKLVLRAAEGARLLPFTTMVGVQTPDLPTRISTCPSLFAPCFDAAAPNCWCAAKGR
jgi:hypothetical protein